GNGVNVGIGTSTPFYRLTVAGIVAPSVDNSFDLGSSFVHWREIFCTNGTINTSDKRLKTNILNLNYCLKEVLAMRPVTFTWKKNPEQGIHVGLIAQELQQLVPEAVKVGDDSLKTLGLNYSELVPVLIKAIQQQEEIIQGQKEELKDLK